MMCNLGLWQPPILNLDGIHVTLNSGWKIWLPKPAQAHSKLVSLAYTVVVYTIFLIVVLVVLFIQSSLIILTHLSEMADQDHPSAESSTNPPALVHTAVTNIAVNSVVPPSTLHTGATGNHLLPADASGPRTRTPLRPLILECELANHPDKAFVQQLISNLVHGCAIGYNGPQFVGHAKHLSSALQHPDIIDDSLKKEMEMGRILGPFDHPPFPNLRCSGLGAVPKHDRGWRIIYHLSAPPGFSINDFIDSNSYSLSYCSVDDAYTIINELGTGALLSKIDLKNAFRLIPVRQSDWNLLGIHWKDKYYIDTCLPFGLRSAPFIFNQLADAIHWILQHQYGVHHLLHYLDDFLTAGLAHSNTCHQNLSQMLSLCDKIGAPIKTEKVEGPTTCLTFLGIVLNTETMEASISSERKESLLTAIHHFCTLKKCTKRELLSLIGKLSFACKVVPAGRIFLRHLIDLSCSVTKLHHHIRMTNEARLDLLWWSDFLPSWSGTSMILDSRWTPSSGMELFTDASGSKGWGAFWSNHWLQSEWSPEQAKQDIVWKELFAIVSAVNTWGHQWARHKILFHCDNNTLVDIWRRGSTRCKEIMALIRLLYFCAARYNIHIMITHIAGVDNVIADAISRFQMQRFKLLAPKASPLPDHIRVFPTLSSANYETSANP